MPNENEVQLPPLALTSEDWAAARANKKWPHALASQADDLLDLACRERQLRTELQRTRDLSDDLAALRGHLAAIHNHATWALDGDGDLTLQQHLEAIRQLAKPVAEARREGGEG